MQTERGGRPGPPRRVPADALNWTIIVPVRGTAGSKSRLGASPELALAIALDTVQAAVAAVADSALHGRVLVVTAAEAAPAFEQLGATVIADAGGGLAGAIAVGLETAEAVSVAGDTSHGAHPVGILLGDLPALRPDELRSALAQAALHPLALIADAENTGSTLVTALRASDHRPAFGEDSRRRHLDAGYVELDIADSSGLRRDVDTREQLAALAGRLGPRTSRLALSPRRVSQTALKTRS